MVALTVNLIRLPKTRWAEMEKWGSSRRSLVPSSQNPFFSRVLASLPLPLPRLRLLENWASPFLSSRWGPLFCEVKSHIVLFLTLRFLSNNQNYQSKFVLPKITLHQPCLFSSNARKKIPSEISLHDNRRWQVTRSLRREI